LTPRRVGGKPIFFLCFFPKFAKLDKYGIATDLLAVKGLNMPAVSRAIILRGTVGARPNVDISTPPLPLLGLFLRVDPFVFFPDILHSSAIIFTPDLNPM
jgi:hypothetical protein